MQNTLPLVAADQRSDEILALIRHSFVEKGFDGASMQDLAKAAGMSAGNFYRYFPSKSAIIAAMITRDLAGMEQEFADILSSPHPMRSLRDAIGQHVSGEGCDDDGLWAEITAAAARKPEIAQVVRRMETEIRGYLIAIFAHATGLSRADAARRFGAHATLVVMMVKATGMQGMETAANGDLVALILRSIDHALNEIAIDDVRGKDDAQG